jgi:hypothetical protein
MACGRRHDRGSESVGIAGDGGSTKTTRGPSRSAAVTCWTRSRRTCGDGDDTVTNNAKIEVLSEATTRELSAAVAIKGVGVAISTPTADAQAAAIDSRGRNRTASPTAAS